MYNFCTMKGKKTGAHFIPSFLGNCNSNKDPKTKELFFKNIYKYRTLKNKSDSIKSFQNKLKCLVFWTKLDQTWVVDERWIAY